MIGRGIFFILAVAMGLTTGYVLLNFAPGFSRDLKLGTCLLLTFISLFIAFDKDAIKKLDIRKKKEKG